MLFSAYKELGKVSIQLFLEVPLEYDLLSDLECQVELVSIQLFLEVPLEYFANHIIGVHSRLFQSNFFWKCL